MDIRLLHYWDGVILANTLSLLALTRDFPTTLDFRSSHYNEYHGYHNSCPYIVKPPFGTVGSLRRKKTGFCQPFVVTYWFKLKLACFVEQKEKCVRYTSKKGRRCPVISIIFTENFLVYLLTTYFLHLQHFLWGLVCFWNFYMVERQSTLIISNLVFLYVYMNKNALNLLNLHFCIIFNFKSNLLFPFIIKAILSFSEENEKITTVLDDNLEISINKNNADILWLSKFTFKYYILQMHSTFVKWHICKGFHCSIFFSSKWLEIT